MKMSRDPKIELARAINREGVRYRSFLRLYGGPHNPDADAFFEAARYHLAKARRTRHQRLVDWSIAVMSIGLLTVFTLLEVLFGIR